MSASRINTRCNIVVTGRGGLWGCEMLSIPHCPEYRLTYNSVVVSLTRRPRSTHQYNFLISAKGSVNRRAIVRLEGLGKLKKKINDFIWTRTRDLQACNIM
jgi:hypothetical protein